MSITVVLHGETRPTGPCDRAVRTLTFDAPRVVLGRGEGCEVRLPDVSVSHRHASLRQRGVEWTLVDEGSANGTRVGREKLGVQAPRRLAGRELVRLGRMWVELVVGTAGSTSGATAAAKEAAIDLVIERLARDGEETRPVVRVVAGPDEGRTLTIDTDVATIGRSREATLVIDEPEASRRHASVRRSGDALVVKDLGSKAGTLLGDKPLGAGEAVWRVGVPLQIGSSVLEYVFEAVEALAELERAPDERVAAADLEVGTEPPYFLVEPASEEEEFDEEQDDALSRGEASPAPAPVVAIEARHATPRRSGWTVADLAVVVLALGVFSLSAVGYLVLLR
jgi:pSer/pThr/pTyr-binding forkhead associated (FHA) protein